MGSKVAQYNFDAACTEVQWLGVLIAFYFATESPISPLIQCHRGENSFPKSLVREEGLHAH